MTEYVVIGDGAAGTTAAQYLRRRDPDGRITIYSDDPNAAYYRAALTNYLIGELREDQLFAVPPDFYARHRIHRVLARVSAIDTAAQRISLASGGSAAYDRLCVAAGSTPNPPPFAGADLAGVMTMRTLQDARSFMEDLRAGRVRRAIVVGGGPLALEWAQGLRARGVEVTYVLRGRRFMDGILDATASDLVASRLRAFGCDLRTEEEVAEVVGDTNGHVRGAILKSGATVQAQLVCVAIGIRTNTTFLEGSGVEVGRGIPVDERMRTNVEHVYAAGDVAEVDDPLLGVKRGLGLWEPARLQGRVAGSNMGGGDAAYRVGVMVNATRLYDLDFAGIGRTIEGDGDRVISDLPRGEGTIAYRKLVIRDGALVGAIMLGHRSERVRRHGLRLRTLIREGTDVSEVADRLLDPAFDLPAWMAAVTGDERLGTKAIALGGAVPTYSRLFRMPDLASPLSRAIARPAEVSTPSLLPASAGGAVGVLEPPTAGPPPGARLSVEGGAGVELAEVTRIGRRPESDLVLADPLVSGDHAEVRRAGDAFVVTDLGSRNGTFLNGRQVVGPTPLADGDVLRLGDTAVRFTGAAPPPPGGPPGAPAARLRAVGPAVSGLFVLPDALELPPPPEPRMLGALEGAGRRFEVLGSVVSIGRDPLADLSLPDPAVSGTHAQIAEHEGALYLRDLGSRNGTYVNGRLVSVPHLLVEGDVVHVGNTDLVFRAPSAERASLAPPRPAGARGLAAPGTPAAPERPAAPSVPAAVAIAAEPVGRAGPAPSAERSGGVRLVVRSGPLVGLAFELSPPGAVVGRDPQVGVSLSEPTVSWRHARFTAHGAAWTIEDLGSTNGTVVNGRPIEPGRQVPIDPEAEVRLGEITLGFEAV